MQGVPEQEGLSGYPGGGVTLTVKHLIYLRAGCLFGGKRTSNNEEAWEWIARWMFGEEESI